MSKLSSEISPRTLTVCARICLYALSTTTRNLDAPRQRARASRNVRETHRVYEIATRLLCHRAASLSLQCPRMLAHMDAAALRPPVMAKCTPDEKNGSMNAMTFISIH